MGVLLKNWMFPFLFLMFLKHKGLILRKKSGLALYASKTLRANPDFFSFSTLLSYSVRNNTKCGFI